MTWWEERLTALAEGSPQQPSTKLVVLLLTCSFLELLKTSSTTEPIQSQVSSWSPIQRATTPASTGNKTSGGTNAPICSVVTTANAVTSSGAFVFHWRSTSMFAGHDKGSCWMLLVFLRLRLAFVTVQQLSMDHGVQIKTLTGPHVSLFRLPCSSVSCAPPSYLKPHGTP